LQIAGDLDQITMPLIRRSSAFSSADWLFEIKFDGFRGQINRKLPKGTAGAGLLRKSKIGRAHV